MFFGNPVTKVIIYHEITKVQMGNTLLTGFRRLNKQLTDIAKITC